MHEPLTSLYAVIAIQFARGTPETEIWRGLQGAATLHRFAGKWIIAIDEDIDPDNADAVFWAMSYRCQPQHDLHVVPHKDPGHGPRGPRDGGESASVLINATLKGPSRGGSAAARVHGERTRDLGAARTAAAQAGIAVARYDLGFWPKELAQQAQLRWRAITSLSAQILQTNGVAMSR